MRPAPLAARKAGAALAVLMLSTALAACQPDGSTDATAPTTATASTESTDQTGTPTNGSITSPTDGSSDGSGSSTGTATPTAAPASTDQTSTPTDGSASNPTGGSQGDAPRGLESFYNQTINWEDCPDGASFKCGTVTVPVDYEHPDGQTITIALKKLPASDGDAEHGSLFLNPGGPGGSGVEAVTSAPGVSEELRGAYDIIGFDPRGVGQSTPITCWSEDEIKQYLENPSSDTSNPMRPLKGVTSKNVAAQDKIDRGASNAARCAKHSKVPELLDHVGTRDVARDLDVLRATNGNARLNYLGVSYGTYIGALYADLFPDRVGHAVLDSAVDPSKRETDSDAERIAFKEGVLRQYVEHCQAQSACPLTGSTDEAVSQLAAFVDGLDKNPLTAPDSDATVNTPDATDIIQQLAVVQPDWDTLTAMLTPAMTNHDGTLMAKAKQNLDDAPPTTVEEAASTANQQIMLSTIICNDNPDTGATASEMDAQTAAERKAYPFFGGISNAMEAYCRGWGHHSKTPPQETHAEGSAPILVVGITGDVQTLYSWSQTLAGQLDNGHLFTVQGYGHGGAIGNCATTATIDFLVNGTVPADGASCTAEPKSPGAEPQLATSDPQPAEG
ncbi:alpha/beta hydrolase [uncultured Actinomyces sp.]|uniref:alpha/beta hydrolase n=1 Tax=uncultured Actinomyces sp. TaxID=249061 RepID=UPI0028D70828|nr:alpha/beta hydrolase [uncultured Actinomyces sp.]